MKVLIGVRRRTSLCSQDSRGSATATDQDIKLKSEKDMTVCTILMCKHGAIPSIYTLELMKVV